MRNLKALIAATMFLFATNAFAEKKEIWHGWASVPVPCSKEFTYKDDFGLTWSSIRTAPQEHHTRIYLDAPNWGDIEAKVKECALISAGVGGGAAFYASPAAAWPAFKATFLACATQKGVSIAENLLSISSGFECRW